MQSRSPHGERGLKFKVSMSSSARIASLPPRGAWIEIRCSSHDDSGEWVAPPTGSVD